MTTGVVDLPATGQVGPAAPEAVLPAPELCIVVPTFNEVANVAEVIGRLRDLLRGIDWEVIFVDDHSPDGTAAMVRRIGEQDRRVRCIHRIGRRGLSGACVEGMLATQARYVAIMDADLQHDERLLVAMLQRIRQDDVDLVVASRYMAEGSAAGFNRFRAFLSRLGVHVAQATGVTISDPMSGFFMMRRANLETLAPTLSTDGFKLLFDIVASAGGTLRTAELPYVFRARAHGESKLDARVNLDYIALVISKLTGDRLSFRFLLFCLVGLTGVGIHMSILRLALGPAEVPFAIAQTIATIGAIAWNFALNNMLTYRDQRLRGWRLVTGLVRFQIVCGVGAISNVGIASFLYGQESGWWVAGLTGAAMGAIWNYMASAAWVWQRR